MEEIDKKIKELQEEGKKLLNQRKQLINSTNQINIRITEIQGALKTLNSLKEGKTKPKDKKNDSKK